MSTGSYGKVTNFFALGNCRAELLKQATFSNSLTENYLIMCFTNILKIDSPNQYLDQTWCKSGIRTPGPWYLGHGTPSKFKSGTQGLPSKSKSGTPRLRSKFKSGNLIIFLHCLTYYVLGKYRDLFFGGGGRNPCNLSGVQLARQFIKVNSFICLK